MDISATVSEEVARALNTKDPLAREGLAVVPKDIAGAVMGGIRTRDSLGYGTARVALAHASCRGDARGLV